MAKNRQYKKRKGFTLVELAISLAIIGIAISSVLPILNQIETAEKKAKTREKMEYVVDMLANYVLAYNDLPCPADTTGTSGDPFGAPRRDCTVNGDDGPGIVPFRALGLREEDVIDEWGNHFTYEISPIFNRGFYAGTAKTNRIHARCRFPDTDVSTPNWIVGGANINPGKAFWCCDGSQSAGGNGYDATDDLQVLLFDGGTNVIATPRNDNGFIFSINGTMAGAQTPNGALPVINPANNLNVPQSPYKDGNFTAVAFVLVSHGPNEFGAFIVDDSAPLNSRYIDDPGGQVGDGETINAGQSTAKEYVLGGDPGATDEEPIYFSDQPGAGHFDDIIMYRTNDSLYAELTGKSCAVP